MLVPKMVKNGLNSVLDVSAVFEQDRYPRKPRTDMKPIRSLNPERRIKTILGQFRNRHARNAYAYIYLLASSTATYGQKAQIVGN
jgi:hypothetical protein